MKHPCLKASFNRHPDDPGTALVLKQRHITQAFKDEDVHTVIWQRGLADTYTAKFNAFSRGKLAGFSNFVGIEMGVWLQTGGPGGFGIYHDNSTNVTPGIKDMAPREMIRDMKIMGRIIAGLSGREALGMLILADMPGGKYEDATVHWHSDRGVTAHMTMNDPVIELLNYTGTGLRPLCTSAQMQFKESQLPADRKIILPEPGDIVVFKETIHRKSSKIANYGRCGLSIFSLI